jgi:putative hydrolase of the HAD superfamily
MIAAVLFDLYETLVTERHAAPGRASSLGERLGLDAAAFRRAWKPQRSRVIRGQVSFADALIEIGARLGRRLDIELVHGIANERRLEKAALFQRVEPVAVEGLHQLRARGFRLGVISNCFEEDVAAWPQCSAAKCFDTSVFSFEVGTAKPEAHIYLQAIQRLGVDSSNAVFVGDGGDDELLGAERVGLRAAQAAWFRGELASLPGHIPRLSSWSAVLALAAAG